MPHCLQQINKSLLQKMREAAEVKIRGFRLELGEVESVLEPHPEVPQLGKIFRDVNVAGNSCNSTFYISKLTFCGHKGQSWTLARSQSRHM
jgi:hypothetical protein